MRGITSIATAMGLMGVAVWIMMSDGSTPQALAAAAMSLFVMYRGYRGIGTNPVEAIVTTRPPTVTAPPSAFGRKGL